VEVYILAMSDYVQDGITVNQRMAIDKGSGKTSLGWPCNKVYDKFRGKMPSKTYIILLILLIRLTFKVVNETIMNKIGNPCKCMNCKYKKRYCLITALLIM